jgi:hypothetical protein
MHCRTRAAAANADGHGLSLDSKPIPGSPGAALDDSPQDPDGLRRRSETSSRKRRSCTLVVQMARTTNEEPGTRTRLSTDSTDLRRLGLGFRGATGEIFRNRWNRWRRRTRRSIHRFHRFTQISLASGEETLESSLIGVICGSHSFFRAPKKSFVIGVICGFNLRLLPQITQITQIVVQKPEPERTIHRLGLLKNPTHERSEGSSNSLGIIISKILRCARNDERRPSSTAPDSAGVPIQNLD